MFTFDMLVADVLIALAVAFAAPFVLARLPSLQADLKPVPVRKRVPAALRRTRDTFRDSGRF